MRKKVFVDTNVLLSGTFFRGNEAKLLSSLETDLITSNTVVEEVQAVAKRKFESLKIESKKVALEEINSSLRDFKKILKKKEEN